jgi:hypothetical protein
MTITVVNNDLEKRSALFHFVGGTTECSKNLEVIAPNMGEFYNKVATNICNGSSLITLVIDSELNITPSAPKYIGVEKCLRTAEELNNR